MYDMLHAKSAEVELEYYESANYYDALHRAQQEVPLRPTRVLANLRQLVQNGISIVAISGLLLWLHWSVVFVLLATALPGALVRMTYASD
jgi:ATP-binding cassette, subfamily B, bacterial